MTDATAKKRIYIAGPMTGHADHNYPAFHAAADRFQRAGWDVVNQIDIDEVIDGAMSGDSQEPSE